MMDNDYYRLRPATSYSHGDCESPMTLHLRIYCSDYRERLRAMSYSPDGDPDPEQKQLPVAAHETRTGSAR